MGDVMLFGSGWNGEVINLGQEYRQQPFSYGPHPTNKNIGNVNFAPPSGYRSSDGNDYLIALAQYEPVNPDVEAAIKKYKPSPSNLVNPIL